MSKIAFMFPGQGAQYIGMGKDFYEELNECRKIYDIADEILDFDIKNVCFNENDLINETEYTQAAILTTSMAIYKAVIEIGIKPDVCCGLSLGEYNALVASGVMKFTDALKTIRKRGILMQEAVPDGKGTMVAVLGLDNEIVSDVCEETEGIVSVANYNCPGQLVISGERESVAEAAQKLKDIGAKRVVELKVSGPFHSEMMAEAGRELRKYIENVEFDKPVVPYVANVNALYIDENKDIKYIKDLLEKQVSTSVMFEQSVRNMIADGVDTFIEIGPGRTLSGLVKKTDRNVRVMNINCINDLKKLIELK